MEKGTRAALAAVEGERNRQTAKWGTQRHSFPVWITVLTEEVGELSQAVLNARQEAFETSDDYEGPQSLSRLLQQRMEAVQCAAVAVSIVEHYDELIERTRS